MIDRPARPVSIPTVVMLLALLASGCASGGNTLAQDLSYESWESCKGRFPTVRLERVEPSGRIWFRYGAPSDLAAANECWRQALDERAKGRAVVSPPSGQLAQPSTSAARIVESSPSMPVWKRGDEWAYRWGSPQGKGTFVWSMDREDTLEGVTYYIVKSGEREIYYRKSDFAYYMDKVNGQIETRHTPPTAFYAWPLVSGAKVEVSYTRERPLERQTEEMLLTCETGAVESVTVQAGTFDAVKVACRNSRSNRPNFEVWLSPTIKHMVRERTYFPYGVRERELIGLKLR